jgi:DNA polymerase III subunit delta'
MADLFGDLIGQPQAVALLTASLQRQRLAPAYLFSGPDGVGRRLAALRFLEGILAGLAGSAPLRRRLEEGNHPDLLWVEPTYQHQGQLIPRSEAIAQGVAKRSLPQLRLEQVRAISRFLARRPLEGEHCLVVIEAVEMMAEGAANALLKTLEEPGNGLLVLLTSAPERLLSTIRSRCQQIVFGRLDPASLQAVLHRQADLQPVADGPEAAGLIALAAGSPGALLHHREPGQPLEALTLARELTETLDLDLQLWLLDWWQLQSWRRDLCAPDQQRIEQLRRQLQGAVQPRLAWEVALLELAPQH